MMPFLKKRQEATNSDPDDPIKRKPDEGEAEDFGILDAIAEDMMEAHSKNDKGLLKSALEAFRDHVRDEDDEQDQEIE